jgi:hypothetical protein
MNMAYSCNAQIGRGKLVISKPYFSFPCGEGCEVTIGIGFADFVDRDALGCRRGFINACQQTLRYLVLAILRQLLQPSDGAFKVFVHERIIPPRWFDLASGIEAEGGDA